VSRKKHSREDSRKHSRHRRDDDDDDDDDVETEVDVKGDFSEVDRRGHEDLSRRHRKGDDWMDAQKTTLMNTDQVKGGYSESADIIYYSLRTCGAVLFCFIGSLLVTMATLYLEEGGKPNIKALFTSPPEEAPKAATKTFTRT
jgi:hypothetical protein